MWGQSDQPLINNESIVSSGSAYNLDVDEDQAQIIGQRNQDGNSFSQNS